VGEMCSKYENEKPIFLCMRVHVVLILSEIRVNYFQFHSLRNAIVYIEIFVDLHCALLCS